MGYCQFLKILIVYVTTFIDFILFYNTCNMYWNRQKNCRSPLPTFHILLKTKSIAHDDKDLRKMHLTDSNSKQWKLGIGRILLTIVIYNYLSIKLNHKSFINLIEFQSI